MILNDEKKLVSFVVPVYNAETTIQSCVASLKKQTFANIEILLVNNCSTDLSLQKCNELAMADNRIRVIDIPEKGVSAARNRGVELATGTYIAFVDADDWIDADVCNVFANLNARYDYDLFCFSAQYHKGNKTIKSFLFADNVGLLSEKQKNEFQIKVLAPNAPYFEYKTNTRYVGSVWGKFYKREILLKNNLRFATETIISEDVLFNTLALDFFHRIGYTRQSFYHYEQQIDSAQNRYRPNSDKYFSFVIGKIQQWLQSTGKDLRYIDAANGLFIHYLFGILKEDFFHKDNRMAFIEKVNLLKKMTKKNTFMPIIKMAKREYFTLPEFLLILLLSKGFFLLVSMLLVVFFKFF